MRRIEIQICVIVFILVSIIPSGALSSIYHVRAGAADGLNNGADWINAVTDFGAVPALLAGDTVYIAAGTYNQGYTFSESGTAAQRIIFKRATILEHGSDNGWDSAYDGVVIMHANRPFAGGPAWSSSGKSYITIDGIDRAKFIIDGQNGAYAYGIDFSPSGSHHITISNVTITGFMHYGLIVAGTLGSVIIDGVEVYKSGGYGGNSAESTECLITIAGNASSSHGDNEIKNSYLHESGISAHAAVMDLMHYGSNSSGWDIHDNVFMQDGAWNGAGSSDHISFTAGNFRIYRNIFYNRGESANQMIYGRYLGNAALIKNINIDHNVFYSGDSLGSAIRFGTFKNAEGNYDPNGGYRDMAIDHNTIYNTTWGIDLQYHQSGTWGDVNISNNIIHAKSPAEPTGAYGVWLFGIGDSAKLNYNFYHSQSGGFPTIVRHADGYYSIAQFRSIKNQELNGLTGDPIFVNPIDLFGQDSLPFTSDDGLRLAAESPAKSSGSDGGEMGAYHISISPDTTPPSAPHGLMVK